jgi:hypothetical protein
MIDLIGALKNVGVKGLSGYLEKEVNRLQYYEALAHLPEGKFLIEELKSRREMARGMYASIDASHTNAMALLLLIQSYEREAEEWLNRITSSAEKMKELNEQIESLRVIMAERKKNSDAGVRFMPEGVGSKAAKR